MGKVPSWGIMLLSVVALVAAYRVACAGPLPTLLDWPNFVRWAAFCLLVRLHADLYGRC